MSTFDEIADTVIDDARDLFGVELTREQIGTWTVRDFMTFAHAAMKAKAAILDKLDEGFALLAARAR